MIPSDQRRLEPLPKEEALRLLASVSLGRVVFTLHALPAIRPVNHLVDDGVVIIRTHLGAALTTAVPSGEVVVAYEVDEIDTVERLGWSVIVTGLAQRVDDPDEAAGYQRLLHPWVTQPTEYVIRIKPEIVTGYRLVEDSVGRNEPREGS